MELDCQLSSSRHPTANPRPEPFSSIPHPSHLCLDGPRTLFPQFYTTCPIQLNLLGLTTLMYYILVLYFCGWVRPSSLMFRPHMGPDGGFESWPLLEWLLQEESQEHGEEFAAVSLCPSQIRHGLLWDWIWASGEKNRRLSASIMSRHQYKVSRSILRTISKYFRYNCQRTTSEIHLTDWPELHIVSCLLRISAGHCLSWLRFFVVYFSPSRRIPCKYRD
jgi:hypothetical protein